jgi:hypothetical protein
MLKLVDGFWLNLASCDYTASCPLRLGSVQYNLYWKLKWKSELASCTQEHNQFHREVVVVGYVTAIFFSNLDYVASNEKMASEWCFRRQRSRPNLRHCPSICLQGRRKTVKKTAYSVSGPRFGTVFFRIRRLRQSVSTGSNGHRFRKGLETFCFQSDSKFLDAGCCM